MTKIQIKSPFLKHFIVFLLFLLFLSLSYAPALTIEYIHHDDFMFLEEPIEELGFHSFALLDISLGRVTGAIIQTLLSWLVDNIGDLNLVRFLTIFQLSLCGVILTTVFQRWFPSIIHSALISFIILSLPSFQILVAYAALSYKFPAILFSLIAAIIADKISVDHPFKTRFLNKYSLLSVFLFFLALTIYQSTATFFWVFAGALFLFSKTDVNQKLVNQFTIGFTTLVYYFISLLTMKSVFMKIATGIYNPYKFNPNLFEKMRWFVDEPIVNSLNLWNIFPTRTVSIITISAVVLGFCVSVFEKAKRNTPGEIFKKVVFGVCLMSSLFILSFLPNLLSSTSFAFYRCIAALTTLIALLLLWSMIQILNLLPKTITKTLTTLILLLGCGVGMISSYHNTFYYRAKPSQAEVEYVRDALLNANFAQHTEVHLILMDLSKLKYRYDEFSILTISFGENYKRMFNYLLAGSSKDDIAFNVRLVESVDKDPSSIFDSSVLVIDMTKLYEPEGELSYLRK